MPGETESAMMPDGPLLLEVLAVTKQCGARCVMSICQSAAGRSLQAAGIKPDGGHPRLISAGDGSVPAFQRIREHHYQIGMVAEPLHLHGWVHRRVDRAFAGEKPSGFIPPRICVLRPTLITTAARTTITTAKMATGTSTSKSGRNSRCSWFGACLGGSRWSGSIWTP